MKHSHILKIAFISIFYGLLVGIQETFPQTSTDEQAAPPDSGLFAGGG